ncbi:MAG: type VI secretion system tube protein Hcp, partial [Herbaspirillum sp.]|nr:type VI secretion system tube protein Hcp [Herbaspirillum sp.]
NCLTPTNQQMGHMEDISFTYEKITWTFDPDGIEAEDSWLAPKS